MAELKTKVTHQNPIEFLNTIEPQEKREDCFILLKIFEKATGEKAVMWGSSIIGFGSYHYKSQRSTQEGDWMKVGFSPRKQNITLYILHGITDHPALEKLGKFTASAGSCLYLKKLSDVKLDVLEDLIKVSFNTQRAYSV